MNDEHQVIDDRKISLFQKIIQRPEWLRAALAICVFLASFAFLVSDMAGREADVMEAQDLFHANTMFQSGPKSGLPDDQSFVYYTILHFWERLNRSSFAFLRIPSAVFVSLGVTCLFLMMEAEMGIVAGLFAALILSINPLIVFYGRQARMYGLIIGLSAACLLFACRYFKHRKISDLAAFTALCVVGSYTHFFFMVFVASMAGLFIIDLIVYRKRYWELPLVGAIGLLAITPQFFRIHKAIALTRGLKNVIGWGLPHEPGGFAKDIARELILGLAYRPPYSTAIFISIGAVILIGALIMKWRGVFAAVLLFVPTFAIAFHFSERSPIASRYILYLVPAAAVFIAALLAKLKKIYLWGPLIAAIMFISLSAVNKEYGPPRHDWNTARDFINSIIKPTDTIIVFPRYFPSAIRRYIHRSNLPFFTAVEDLERILARTNRAILVHGPHRYFDSINSFIKTRGKVIQKFSTKVRGRLEIFVLNVNKTQPIAPAMTDDPTIIFGGVIGSGGYGWQTEKLRENPFAPISPYFKSADFVAASYESYAPYQTTILQKLFGIWLSPAREPNSQVANLMAQAGIHALVILPSEKKDPKLNTVLAGSGLKMIPDYPILSAARPAVFKIKDIDVAFLYSSQHVFTDRPNHKGKKDAIVADWEKAVKRAKEQVGPTGRLVMLMSEPANYDRLYALESQMLARRAIDLGADVVIGTGGYCAKNIEEYKEGVIAYSPGTLVRPGYKDNVSLESSGYLFRVRFPKDKKVGYEMLPIYFDDKYYLTYGRPENFKALAATKPSSPEAEHLMDKLIFAKAGCTVGAVAQKKIEFWNASIDPSFSIHEGYSNSKNGDGTAVAISEIKSSGELGRGIIFRQITVKRTWVTFEKVFMGEQIQLRVAVPDFVINNFGKPAQFLKVFIADKAVLDKRVLFITGWKDYFIDTKELAGTEQNIKIMVEASQPNKTFHLAVDPIILRGESALQAMEALPYKFDEHLGEAKVSVLPENAVQAPSPVKRAAGAAAEQPYSCAGPDEAYRRLKGEEDGPYGEGVIYRRWYCGELPWDATALTIQRSGGILRPAIWHHPLDKATRQLTYEDVPIRSVIRGYMGFTDMAIKKKNNEGVVLTILIGGEKIFSDYMPNQPGWKDFSVDIPKKFKGKKAKVTFLVNTKNQTWRHFCFNAQME